MTGLKEQEAYEQKKDVMFVDSEFDISWTSPLANYFTCPFCHLAVPSQEIEGHANDHLVDAELSRDLELAHQVTAAPPSPSPFLVDGTIKCDSSIYTSNGSSSSRDSGNSGACAGNDLDEKICSLIGLQIKETFYPIEDGLIALLRNCLESDSENLTSILCGYVDHFQSRKSEDDGWGCGWRNIQMLASHILKKRPDAREILFGGSGFVPDIASLQRWLEIAWASGFDVQGSNDFDGEIYGKRNWIGTTECAALLRSFGLRAVIVDFCSKEIKLTKALNHGKIEMSQDAGKRQIGQIHGPMDKFLSRKDHKPNRDVSTEHCKSSSIFIKNGKGHEVIFEWVWKYFSDNNSTKIGSGPVVLSQKAPLYFQHDGHSRTIIGIQAVRQRNGRQRYNLLILDPAYRTQALEKSLKEKFGWQRQIKRGVHTLKKLEYQLCVIDPGIASFEEMEHLKTLDSIYCEL